MDDQVRFEIPYFAHDVLDPKIYPKDLGVACGGPSPLPRPAKDGSKAGGLPVDGGQHVENAVQVEAPKPSPARTTACTKPKTKKRQVTFAPLPENVKKPKVTGGRAAAPKKVSWDLDSDDELLVKMKQAKHTDAEVAEYLRATGRVRYHHKTINSRYTRILKAIDAHEAQMLDAGEHIWDEANDQRLLQAVQQAERRVDTEKRKIDGRKWTYVAAILRGDDAQGSYSTAGCRERFKTLEEERSKQEAEPVDADLDSLFIDDGMPPQSPLED